MQKYEEFNHSDILTGCSHATSRGNDSEQTLIANYTTLIEADFKELEQNSNNSTWAGIIDGAK